MTTPISAATQSPPATNAAVKPPTVKQDEPALKAQPSGNSTVRISDAAQSALKTALAESIETPAQTSKEARGNDLQAKRLMAAEAARKR